MQCLLLLKNWGKKTKNVHTLDNIIVIIQDVSTIVGYLIPNHVFTYIFNIWFVNTFCRYTQLNHWTISISNNSI